MRPRAGERARPTSRPRLPSRGRTRWLASTYLCLGSPRAGCAGPHADGTRRLHPPPANSLCLCQRDGQIDRQADEQTEDKDARSGGRRCASCSRRARSRVRSLTRRTTPRHRAMATSAAAQPQLRGYCRTVVPSRLQSNLTVSRRVDSGRCFKINSHSGLPPRPVSTPVSESRLWSLQDSPIRELSPMMSIVSENSIQPSASCSSEVQNSGRPYSYYSTFVGRTVDDASSSR